MTIKEINELINEEKKKNEEENKAARQEFEKDMELLPQDLNKTQIVLATILTLIII